MRNPSTTLEDLTNRLRDALTKRREVQEAYLFGSVARGQAQQHSDLDIAVYVQEPVPNCAPFGYASSLSSELMTALAVNRIDLVLLNRASPLLYHRVLRDGVRLLSHNLQATTKREAQAISRYCDFLPQLKKIQKALDARINERKFAS